MGKAILMPAACGQLPYACLDPKSKESGLVSQNPISPSSLKASSEFPMTFRLSREDDYARVEELALASFRNVTWARRVDRVFGPPSGKDWRERWRLRMKSVFENQIILVGESEGKMIGFCTATFDEPTRWAYIDIIGVEPALQGKGAGRRLLRAMMTLLEERGARHLHLDCLVENDAGNRLYR